VTTVEQETGVLEKTKEPLRTLATFRTGKQLGWMDNKGSARYASPRDMHFGWNAVPHGEGCLAVGDALEVTERAPWA
jgi:uncharacterized protein YcbX